MNDIEQIFNELQEVNTKLEVLDKEIGQLDEEIKEGQERYPDIKISEIREMGLDANKYIEKQEEVETKIKLREDKIKEESSLLAQKIELEEKKKVAEEEKKTEKIKSIEEIRTRKEQKEELSKEIEKFKTDFNKIMAMDDIIKGKDMDKLMAMRGELNDAKFLTAQERKDCIDKIDNKLAENNLKIEIKEGKVNKTKKFKINNKERSIVAKGQNSTINFIKGMFNKSAGKVVSGVNGLFDRLKSRKAMQASIEALEAQIAELKSSFENAQINQAMHAEELDDAEIMNMMSEAQSVARKEENNVTQTEPQVETIVNNVEQKVSNDTEMKEGTTASRNETIEHYKSEREKIVKQLEAAKEQLEQSRTMAQMTGNMFVDGTENVEETKSSVSM